MSLKKRESQLTKWLAGVEEIEKLQIQTVISITSIATESTVGISNLVRNLNLKKVSSLFELQLNVSNKDLLNSLRHRIMQLKGKISYSRNFRKSSVSLSC